MKDAKDMTNKSHWLKGTMTPPGGETIEIAYEVAMGEQGPKGWIVADGDDGEQMKIAMKDLSMDGDYVNYSWSPPDEADLDASWTGAAAHGWDTSSLAQPSGIPAVTRPHISGIRIST